MRLNLYSDEITLSFGQQGHVISLAYSPLVSPLAPKTCDELSPPTENIQFNSKVDYETAVPGMSLKTILPSYQPPPGLKFIPGSSSSGKPTGAGAGMGGDAKPEGFGTKQEAEAPFTVMGFLQRYWYIILPIVIMNSISSEPEPQQQGQGQAAAGGAAAQGGGGGQVAAAAAGGSPAKRRGKRG